MNIITQFYKNKLKEKLISKISNITSELVDEIVDNLQSYNNNKYFNLINSIQESTMEIIKETIIQTFEEIDTQYKCSDERLKKYTINKLNVNRTITTIVGDLTFKRTYYISKLDNSYHFYVDEIFDLPKYDHYDPVIKDIAIDKAFSTNQIQAGKDELKVESNNIISYRLCKFHFKQAINHLTSDDSERKNLLNIFNNKSKKEFINEVNKIIKKNKNREEIINKKLNYILNNYKAIKDMNNSDVGSSMESHISHCIANLFASRPKGYSSKNIKKYLQINDYKNNNLNILYLYSKTYNDTETRTINENDINYSIFDKKGSNIPIIDQGKVNGTYTIINALAH